MNGLLRTLAHFAIPVALIGTAFGLVIYSSALPPSLAGLKSFGPYIVFALGRPWRYFNRGRALSRS